LIIDLGTVLISSNVANVDKEKDYRKVRNPNEMFDAYNFELNGFQVLAVEELEDYRRYKQSKHTKIIRDITVQFGFLNSIMPSNKLFPAYEVELALQNVDLVVSDYISLFLQRLLKVI